MEQQALTQPVGRAWSCSRRGERKGEEWEERGEEGGRTGVGSVAFKKKSLVISKRVKEATLLVRV